MQDVINAYYLYNQNKTQAAESLGIHRRTFGRKLDKALEMGLKPKIRVKCGVETVRKKIKYDLHSRPLRIVYFTDAHNQPKLSRERFKWLGEYVNDINPDLLICGGDFDDFESLCSHVRNDTFKARSKPSFRDDLSASYEAHGILDETIRNPVRKVRTGGNHEHRIFTFEDGKPETKGMLENEYFSMLQRYGWEYIPYGEYFTIENVDFVHCPFTKMGKPMSNVGTIARQSVNDIVFGHTHELKPFHETKLGPQRSVFAYNAGCFFPEGYIPDYAKNTRVHYWRGVHYFEISQGLQIKQSLTLQDLERAYG